MNGFLSVGLLISEATLAKNLFTEIPAEAVSPVSSKIFDEFLCYFIGRFYIFFVFGNI